MTDAPDEILTPEEAGQLMKLDTKTLRRWRYERRGPAYFSLTHRTVRYYRSDVEAFIKDRAAATKSGAR